MKKPLVIAVVVGGLALLCCGGLMVVGLLANDGDSAGAPGRSSAGGGGGLEGTWIHGSATMTEYRSTLTGEFAPPSGTGMMYELKGGGACVYSAMLQSTVYSCTSWIFIGSDDCSWSSSGNQLDVTIGAGTMRSRMCGGEVKEADSRPMERHYRVELGEASGTRTLTLTDLSDDASLLFRAQ